jgi:hypothetical protein
MLGGSSKQHAWMASVFTSAGKQNKLSYVYDMHHNLRFFSSFPFCKDSEAKMQGQSPLYERKAPGWAHDDAATVLNYSI